MRKLPTVVIGGSYRKFWWQICGLIYHFERLGCCVLEPRPGSIINPGAEYVIIDINDTDDPALIEKRFLEAVRAADVFYVYNPVGYIGNNTMVEIGCASAWRMQHPLKKPAIFMWEPYRIPVFLQDPQEHEEEWSAHAYLALCGVTVATPEQVRRVV